MEFAAPILGIWLKSLVVLALAGATCLIWRRASAAARHLIWFLALAVLPALPLLTSILPSWQKPLWSMSAHVDPGNQISFAVDLGSPAAPGTPDQASQAAPAAGSDLKTASRSATGRHLAGRFNRDWLALAAAAWLAGTVLVLIRAVAGRLHLRRICRTKLCPRWDKVSYGNFCSIDSKTDPVDRAQSDGL